MRYGSGRGITKFVGQLGQKFVLATVGFLKRRSIALAFSDIASGGKHAP